MNEFITSMQQTITGWASPLQTAVTAVLTAFVVIAGLFIVASLLKRAFKAGAR